MKEDRNERRKTEKRGVREKETRGNEKNAVKVLILGEVIKVSPLS